MDEALNSAKSDGENGSIELNFWENEVWDSYFCQFRDFFQTKKVSLSLVFTVYCWVKSVLILQGNKTITRICSLAKINLLTIRDQLDSHNESCAENERITMFEGKINIALNNSRIYRKNPILSGVVLLDVSLNLAHVNLKTDFLSHSSTALLAAEFGTCDVIACHTAEPTEEETMLFQIYMETFISLSEIENAFLPPDLLAELKEHIKLHPILLSMTDKKDVACSILHHVCMPHYGIEHSERLRFLEWLIGVNGVDYWVDTKIADCGCVLKPIHICTMTNQYDLLHCLLSYSQHYDINHFDSDGKTCLSHAAEIGSREIIDYLFDHGGKFGFSMHIVDVYRNCVPKIPLAERLELQQKAFQVQRDNEARYNSYKDGGKMESLEQEMRDREAATTKALEGTIYNTDTSAEARPQSRSRQFFGWQSGSFKWWYRCYQLDRANLTSLWIPC